MRLKLIFVPRWLEHALKALDMSLSDVLEPEKLVRILSRSDLDLYRRANDELYHLVPYPIVETFPNGISNQPIPPKGMFRELDEETKRSYLYGNVSTMYDGHLSPVFCVHRVGYEHVFLTVGSEAAIQPEANDILMDALLKELYAVTPLSELAALPLFKAHLNNHLRPISE